jgi:alkylation response protein AidB-like acyl-CoA dehydrogenase
MQAIQNDGPATETPEQAVFRDEARQFLQDHARPRRDKGMWGVNFVTDPVKAAREFETGRAWQATLFAHGFAGLTYPKELGGRGGQPWHETIFREEASSFEASSGFISSTIAMLGPTLMLWGTDEQRTTLIPRLLSGQDAWCQLFSEPGAGSDLAGLSCRAIRDGDQFIVSGQKVWNSAAQWCDKGMLLVRTNPDLPKHRGITFLLVDMHSPGIEVRPLVQATGAQHFNEVFLTDVRVPVSNVLGKIDDGWRVARTVLSNEAAFIGGAGGGVSPHDRLVALARMFGRLDDPSVRQSLAYSFTREKLLGVMGERIMAAVRRREAPPIDPSILKLYLVENRVRTGNLAAEIAGAAAMAAPSDQEVARWIQAELLGRFSVSIGGGTNEVQRNNLAERALGLPREPRSDHEIPWRDVLRN